MIIYFVLFLLILILLYQINTEGIYDNYKNSNTHISTGFIRGSSSDCQACQ